jgi:hypothetical protein
LDIKSGQAGVIRDQLCVSHGCGSGFFLTAYNPYSQIKSDQENRYADNKLLAQIHALQVP